MAARLFERIAALVRVNVSDLLLDTPDSQDAARHYVAEMEDGLAQAKDAVASAVAQEHQLERQVREAQAACAEWDERADAALRAGDEGQARLALRRKQACERAGEQAQAQLDRQRQTLAEMKASLGALQAKIEDVRRQARMESKR